MSEPSPVVEPASDAQQVRTLRKDILRHLVHLVGKDPEHATQRDWLTAVSYAVRDRLIERRMYTRRQYHAADVKRVYYLSMEFLLGRALKNALYNTGLYDHCVQALTQLGVDIDDIESLEPDAALGNGGLGRLAACILDSLATQCLPGYGYGIRYEFGMFRQDLANGQQIERPDAWLRYGNPWELPRPEMIFPVHFYGRVSTHQTAEGSHAYWEPGEEVIAMPFDYPVPGYGEHKNVNNLRLWTAKANREFDLRYFNEGDYIRAVELKDHSETISKVLYPNDATASGRELRLKQEFFFVSASLQDILKRHQHYHGHPIEALPDKVAIQLNDTHPAIAVAELMRLLVDMHELPWDLAWTLTTGTLAYTNHTLMPEALETWPVGLMERVLPRHIQIIYEINHRFLTEVRHRWPGDTDRVSRMSIIDEAHGRRVRMAHLAVVGSRRVNGVAELHTHLLTESLFRDFYELWPERFVNVTNGITPRLWLHQANPSLRVLLDQRIGNDWVTDQRVLRQIEPLAEDAGFRADFRAAKLANKQRLAALIAEQVGVKVDPRALFDVQIKRFHEYKRQLLNLLHLVLRYNRLRDGVLSDPVPRVAVFAGKAAPGYLTAKQIIRLINNVADVVNNDPSLNGALKIAFIPNYEVSSAARIIPGADLSEQISTAGTEASGTGNMKLALNGALTIGTLDGANIEICEAVGEENMFVFGLHAEEVEALRRSGYRPRDHYESQPELRRALDMIAEGFFSPEEPGRYRELVERLLDHDPFLLLADFAAYVQAQDRVDAAFKDAEGWTRMAVLNTARLDRFCIDRTVFEYAEKIWGVAAHCYIEADPQIADSKDW